MALKSSGHFLYCLSFEKVYFEGNANSAHCFLGIRPNTTESHTASLRRPTREIAADALRQGRSQRL